jgi:hypothetical protein
MDGRLPETHPATPKQDTSLASTRRRLLGQSVLRAGHFMRPRQPASVRAPPTFSQLAFCGYPPEKQEQATLTVLAQAKLLCKDWVA